MNYDHCEIQFYGTSENLQEASAAELAATKWGGARNDGPPEKFLGPRP